MPRVELRIFVNREEEIEEIINTTVNGFNVLLIGLRGYGKSSIASRIARILEERGIKTMYIDCQRIINPSRV